MQRLFSKGNPRSVESDEQREERLEKSKQYKKRQRSAESNEQKQRRFARDRERQRNQRNNETENKKQKRLEKAVQYKQKTSFAKKKGN